MTDKTTLLHLQALRRALAEPAGLPLHSSRADAGLFPSTQAGKAAARNCLDARHLRASDHIAERFVPTDAGLAWLLEQTSPRQVLDDLVRALEQRRAETAALVAAARNMETTLDAIRARVDRVLLRLPTAERTDWQGAVLDFLAAHRKTAVEDCPLPDLYRQAKKTADLSIGGFHDGLRRLHEGGRIHLHPWTGPLHELPEPSLAMMVGHQIAYYARASA